MGQKIYKTPGLMAVENIWIRRTGERKSVFHLKVLAVLWIVLVTFIASFIENRSMIKG